MGHRFCQWNQGLCVALAVCLVLCLVPGVEALKCKRCRAKNDQQCRSREKTCENTRDDAVCMVKRKYIDDRLVETFMTCAVDGSHCGLEIFIADGNLRVENECCSERDFCSNDLLEGSSGQT